MDPMVEVAVALAENVKEQQDNLNKFRETVKKVLVDCGAREMQYEIWNSDIAKGYPVYVFGDIPEEACWLEKANGKFWWVFPYNKDGTRKTDVEVNLDRTTLVEI